jgi:16S rRNA (guanine527-N7)-methyltransferase
MSEEGRHTSSRALNPQALDRLEDAYRDAVERGFLGPRELARLRQRHLEDALGLAAIRTPAPGEEWVDLGSGAGLPGLPLAAAYPDTQFTLVDAQRRRLEWVMDTAEQLGLQNLQVVHARLEDYGHGAARERFDVATARALGPLPVVAELGLPLLRRGGVLIVLRGQPAPMEISEAAAACEQLGGRIHEVVPNPSSPIDRLGLIVIMTKIAVTSSRFPRRAGIPARNPLGQGRGIRSPQ